MTNYKENPNRKVFNIDFDHTLTADKIGIYSSNPEPNNDIIQAVNKKYMSGNIIIIWSARTWKDASFLVSWLIKNGVPYHGVFMQKGGSDHYVDDKSMLIDEFKKD